MASCKVLNPCIPPLPSDNSRIRGNRRVWNSTLNHHIKLKNDEAILQSYSEMEATGVFPSQNQLPVILKACARLKNFEFGLKIHSTIVKSCLIDDTKVMTALILFYCKCGFLDAARKLFDDMADRDLVSWNAMICGFVDNLRSMDALSLFRRMRSCGLRPNGVTLVSLLSACWEMEEIKLGREIHCYCLRNGLFDCAVHVGTALIDFYSKFDAMASRSVFNSMEVRNNITWNVILCAYLYAADFDEVMILFIEMLVEGIDFDSVAFLAILESCADHGCLECGKQIHQLAIKHGFLSDIYVANALIVMYGKCGDVDSSYQVFDTVVSADLALWNAMLASYRNSSCFSKAFDLFKKMQENRITENSVTLATMLSICAQSGRLEMGKELHAYVIKTGSVKDSGVENALLNMYVESSSISCACRLFNKMERVEVFSWNTLIKALIDNGCTYQAWELFDKMHDGEEKPNSFTMVSLLSGCEESSVKVGKSIHGYIVRYGFDVNPSLCTALTNMYMRCGNEPAAVYFFWTCSDRDLVSWNAMIGNYFHAGQPCKALSFFSQMLSEVKPNGITIIISLLACARMADLPKGRSLHTYIRRREMNLDSDTCLANALLTMYAKCGSLEDAKKIFRNLKKKDVISWNAMIAAYGMHGKGNDAVELFYRMVEAGEKPTSVTFVSVLSSCSHSGLVEEGYRLFHSMVEDYGIEPQVVHYGCMVDLFGRSGFVDAALNLVQSMPMEPDASLWRALLGACKLCCNLEMARFVAQKLNELEPQNSANYKLLSNIHAAAGRWEDAEALKKGIKERGLQSSTGTSWMASKNQIHSFTAGNW
ncbi:pentatricopeptide repeat-containing protein At2g13600-like [Phalaenopsis equestris]|uniref:pentatricopeptide repeat-containing protein At2g13600-like n=1 Tax=Phalaenopsis equestris TaxID=78828 RepID=UPI0009E51F4C|nr:pentatricopeptide repeat-containing protein At2g13600-like [Phalaenopsis equestris]